MVLSAEKKRGVKIHFWIEVYEQIFDRNTCSFEVVYYSDSYVTMDVFEDESADRSSDRRLKRILVNTGEFWSRGDRKVPYIIEQSSLRVPRPDNKRDTLYTQSKVCRDVVLSEWYFLGACRAAMRHSWTPEE